MTKDHIVKDSISVILVVHNQEKIIGNVVKGILENMSDNVKDMFIILADCNDESESEILFSLAENKKEPSFIVNLVYSEYNNKLIANNIGCQSSENEYSLIIPDNKIIDELFFDKRLLDSFESSGDTIEARNGNIISLIKNSDLTELNFEGIDLNE